MVRRLLTALLGLVLVAALTAAGGDGHTRAAVGPSTAISVADEAAYRDALTTLSSDSSGPHVIEVTGDMTLDDGTDPTYTGTQPLTVNGNGHTIDATGTSRALHHDTTALLILDGLPDVPAWIDEAVRWAVATSTMTGYPDSTFRPDAP